MKEFELILDYLEHDSGTKFYETISLTERIDAGPGTVTFGPSILIQRWGKIAMNTGGGATKFVKGGVNPIDQARNKILHEKRSVRTGKGQYLDKKSPFFGFGRLIASNASKTISAKDMLHMLVEHYNKEDQAIIANYFGYDLGDDLSDEDEDIIEEGLDENDRGPQWASW